MDTTQATSETAVRQTLRKLGINHRTKIVDTLQGSIWRGKYRKGSRSKQSVVVKVTNKKLHSQSIVVLNGQKHKVLENIVSESKIQKYLTSKPDCPNSIVKFHDLSESKTNYFLIMDDGGESLLDFIVKLHHYTSQGSVTIDELQRVIKVIFKQMISCIEYMHSQSISHHDISLENWLINDINVSIINDKLYFDTDMLQIKCCDFGLAEMFESDSFESRKWCGKPNYYSPEVTNRQTFNAKANDIWCAGVCLWMMITGVPPFVKTNTNDQSFNYIMNGNISRLLTAWNKIQFVNEDILTVLNLIFQYEEKRCDIISIKKSEWLMEK